MVLSSPQTPTLTPKLTRLYLPLHPHASPQLSALGVPPEAIKFGSCTMQSENWIVTCESGSVTLCDLKNGGTITKRPIQAEAALMNPTVSILALRR